MRPHHTHLIKLWEKEYVSPTPVRLDYKVNKFKAKLSISVYNLHSA